ncbi:MAG: von Willebrand factor type A domain-containing protein [Bacteroidales bacterium]|nr:von Willebrand factor type A domain-containing protein [Bacteroidales bacterium]MBP5521767.1 von Willebrand factor type A domain-containing protein [Bacteroidales bacterium]
MKNIFKLFVCTSILFFALSCSKDHGFMGPDFFPSDSNMVNSIGGPDPGPEGSGDNFDKIIENPFIKVSEQPLSTFSIDADGASYAYMRRCISDGRIPSPDAIRTEEFLNYFTFDYPSPQGDDALALNAEIGDCPWAEGHKLLRIGLKGKELKEADMPDANYILLVDTSGSMAGPDRIELLKSGLCNMLDQMRPTDKVALITYSGKVSKELGSTYVKDAEKIKNKIKSLTASGSTAGGAAMKMAYEEAVENFVKGGNNRIIMCTDGDFNVGVSSTEELVEMVESYLDKGIYLSIMGFGTGNYQDSRMENLSNHGNGTYTYIDCEDEMMKVFVHERSRFYSVANDTKCQVKFTENVDSYRLIGYENRLMSSEEFNDDKKDAGEIGAGQTITALYELIPSETYTMAANAAIIEVRYKKRLGEDSFLLSTNTGIPTYDGFKPSAEFNFAAGLAAYALTLRNSEYKGTASLSMAEDLIKPESKPGGNIDPLGLRSALVELIQKASELIKD